MGLKIQNVWNHHLDLILMSSDILSTSLYLHCSPCKATTSQQDKHWSWSFTQMGKIVFYNRTLHAISMWFSSCDFFADINVGISQQTLHYTHLWKEAVAWCYMTISIWYRPTNSSRPSPIPNCPPPFCPGQIDPGWELEVMSIVQSWHSTSCHFPILTSISSIHPCPRWTQHYIESAYIHICIYIEILNNLYVLMVLSSLSRQGLFGEASKKCGSPHVARW